MSTSKHMDKLGILAAVAAVLITVLLINGAALGIQFQTQAMGYESKLFDTSRVHTIDIRMEDWEGFLATAQSEEYALCDVVIDGEAFSNVGIRGKGNTSLSTVASMDSSRYSFKIEFDQYDSAKRYYGLDKLSLNNLIQDNTMMKDYLTYRMMHAFGVAAPLCSYVYITVNGEDWGLYLAVEAVEESFLQRNYGSSYGDLYKPDSMNMGGGRGNGKDFNFEDFMSEAEDSSNTVPSMPGGQMMPEGTSGQPSFPEGFDPSQMMPGGNRGNAGFDPAQMGGMGSGDTKLQYVDDQASSYSVIFDSAKTDVTAADQQRLIGALKGLSEDPETAVDTEAVIRYFVVHNYVVNADSYTGSMIHNYYLYEEDGKLSMIPWDYNLAFGTFQGGNAQSMVNDSIDAPLSVTGSDRPMIDWILNSEEYTARYHAYFQEFLDSVDAASIIAQAKALIAPYVEKDPTKFCTYEEFAKGVETLAAFCFLRNQSIAGQLTGSQEAVDASSITLSDMGTMGGGKMPGNDFDVPAAPDSTTGATQRPQMPSGQGDMQIPGGQGGMQMPGSQEGMQMPGGMAMSEVGEAAQPGQNAQGRFPSGNTVAASQQGGSPWLLLALTGLLLIAGLVFAFKFKA